MAGKEKKLVIENTSKSVKVLKARGKKPLRLFPGFNYIPEKNLDVYLEGNPAAQGIMGECCKKIDPDKLNSDEKKLATAAHNKNEAMNKAVKVIKQNKIDLTQKDKTIGEMQVILDKQAKLIQELSDKMANVDAKIDDAGKVHDPKKDK